MKNITIIASMFLVISLAHAEWERIPGSEEMGYVYAMASDGDRLYAGAKHGVFISLDDGDTWCPTGLNHGIYAIAIGWDGAVYASGGYKHGLYRSDTHGDTWKKINNGLRTWERDDGLRFPSIEQILPTTSRSLIAIPSSGPYISHNRGDSWQWMGFEWVYGRPAWEKPYAFGHEVTTMTEFDGYLWAYTNFRRVYRSSDNGETWDKVPEHDELIPVLKDNIRDIKHWAVLDNRLYVATSDAFGVWNEGELIWENLNEGLPVDNTELPAYREYLRTIYDIFTLAVNRGRIFAGVRARGVWVFDERSQTWIPVGLNGRHVGTLVSHQSYLYAATSPDGIYRASIPNVQPYGKAAAIWGALKTE